jgi:hypothetical protein
MIRVAQTIVRYPLAHDQQPRPIEKYLKKELSVLLVSSILFSFLYADAPSKTIRLAQFLLDRHIFFYFFFSFQPFLPHLHWVARTLSTVIIHTTPAHTYKKRKKKKEKMLTNVSAFGSQLTSSNKFKNGTFHPVGYFSALLENGKDSSIPFRQLSKVMRYNNRRRKEQVFKDRK